MAGMRPGGDISTRKSPPGDSCDSLSYAWTAEFLLLADGNDGRMIMCREDGRGPVKVAAGRTGDGCRRRASRGEQRAREDV